MKRIMAAFAGNTVFANILLVLIMMAGGIAAMSMIRENFSEFSVDIITISVAYPGADPEAVEEGISRKIEEALEGLEGVKQYTTESRENAGVAIIEVKENYAEGMPFFESIIKGGARRFRAIFLTTISTAGGLLPLIAEKDMQAKYLIPMALSLAAGVIFATVLTLVLIPSLLVILNDLRLLLHRLRLGTWPRRVDVEPARNRKRKLDEAASEIHQPALISSVNMEGIAKN